MSNNLNYGFPSILPPQPPFYPLMQPTFTAQPANPSVAWYWWAAGIMITLALVAVATLYFFGNTVIPIVKENTGIDLAPAQSTITDVLDPLLKN